MYDAAPIRLSLPGQWHRGICKTQMKTLRLKLSFTGLVLLAACAKAMHDTYMHLKADADPEDLKPKLATPEVMARLLKVADYQRWNDTYLN